MYVVKLDRSWLWTPRLCHRGFLRDQDDIESLKRAGVRELVIDTLRGRDVPAEPPLLPLATEEPAMEADTGPACGWAELADEAAVRGEAIEAVERLFDGVVTGVPLDRPGLQRLVTGLMERLLSNEHRLLTLTFLEQMRRTNSSLHAHAVDTCVLALVVGRACGLRGEDLTDLGQGAILHDVGHLTLPPPLHSKDAPYTPEEQAVIEQHPSRGVELMGTISDLPPAWIRIIMEHHERVDGTGYPAGLRGAHISLLSQIVGAVDRYDAMAAGRDGSARTRPDDVLRLLYRDALAGRYHHDAVSHLIRTVGVYPVGSLVELLSGERGIVVAVRPEQRLSPVVKIITDPNGARLPTAYTRDLAAPNAAGRRRMIRQVLNPRAHNVDIASYL